MFGSLKGIKPARDVRERAESTLEKLLKEEENRRKEYAGRVDGDWGKNHDSIYLPLYRSLFSTLPAYTEKDLQSVLLTKANNNYRNNEAKVLGMYTGVLLHVLTERLEKEGKKAVFTFDLSENELNYLFFFAKRAGEVTVRNVKGENTCSYFASFGGKAEKLVIEGNQGDFAASWAGSDSGNVGTLIVKDNEGDFAAYRAGSNKGTVGTLIVNGNRGYGAAFEAGSYNGKVGTLIVKDNEGNNAASLAGSYNGKVGTLALYKAGTDAGIEAIATKLITGEKALALYKRLEKELLCLKA